MRGKERKQHAHRRGAVAVWTAMAMTTLCGFAALSVDIGYLYVVRTQLQTAADAAALAGATAYLQDAGLAQEQSGLTYLASGRAQQISLQNISDAEGTILEAADILLGRHDFDNPGGVLSPSGRWNAVEVTARCTPGSANGAVSLFFAAIFGITESGVIATARAAMDDRFAGYKLEEDGALIPFTIHEDLFEDMRQNGPDDFSYDGEVKPFSDGIREVKLFPWKWHHTEGPDAAGNFGTLNVGIGSQGTCYLESQILNGISAQDLRQEFGTSELVIYDPDGSPRSYAGTGNPGLSTGMKDSVDARRGDVVGFFIHRAVVLSGSNATYDICGIRFGRIVEVHLTGNPAMRTLGIQPAAYTSGYIIVADYAPPTDGLVGRVILVQ